MGLPGRPNGNPDEIRACAQEWSVLASFLNETEADLSSMVQWLTADASWKGPASQQFASFWGKYSAKLPQIAHECSTVSNQLDSIANSIESAQQQYDHMLEIIGATAAVGIGLTLVSCGISDLIGGVAEGGEVSAVAALVAEIAATLDDVATFLGSIIETIGELASDLVPDFVLESSFADSVTSAVSGLMNGIVDSPEVIWLRSAGWMPTLARAILLNAGIQFGSGMGLTLVKNITDPGNLVHAEATWLDQNAASATEQSLVWGGVMFGAEFGGPILAKALAADPSIKLLGPWTAKGVAELGVGVAAGAVGNGLVLPALQGQGLANPANYLEGGAFGGIVGETQQLAIDFGKKLPSMLQSKAADALASMGITGASITAVTGKLTDSLSTALIAAGQHPILSLLAVEGATFVTINFVVIQGKTYMIGNISPQTVPVSPHITYPRQLVA